MDLSDDFRDGFVDSLRARHAPDRRPAWPRARADRTGGNFTVFHSGVYTACEAVQGRSEEAAAVAGQGGAHHPRPGREDDLFRGRALEFFGSPIA